MSNFNLTLFEACEYLNKSKKSISRYVRKGLLHPRRIKSQQGTLEYRFSKADLEAFKAQETDQSGQDTPQETSQDSTDETRPAEADKTRQETTKEKTPVTDEQPTIRQKKQDRQDTPAETSQDKKQEIAGISRNQDETSQDKAKETSQDQPPQTGQDSQVIELLKETTGMLREQLGKKDEQINSLSETVDQLIQRDRETNVLLKGLHDKILMLEPPKPEETGQTTEQVKSKSDKTGQDEKKESVWQRLVKWYQDIKL